MKTLKQIRDAVIDDLDLYDESFAETSDLNRWIRDAVSAAEASIHSLYQDYFLSMQEVDVTSELIDYPTDIYANKIRNITHIRSGNDVYEIKKCRNISKAMRYEDVGTTTGNETVEWFPLNNASTGRKIRLTPKTSASGKVRITYIRNAKSLENDSDVCDIDEFSRFIEQYTKTMAYMKDGDPRAEASKALEQQYRAEMEQSLRDMSADYDNTMEVDESFYEECV